MIVQCDQCQTRFRIPDEKLSFEGAGTKVRCGKCQHTFRVSREPDESTQVTSVPETLMGQADQLFSEEDPFEAFGGDSAPASAPIKRERPAFDSFTMTEGASSVADESLPPLQEPPAPETASAAPPPPDESVASFSESPGFDFIAPSDSIPEPPRPEPKRAEQAPDDPDLFGFDFAAPAELSPADSAPAGLSPAPLFGAGELDFERSDPLSDISGPRLAGEGLELGEKAREELFEMPDPGPVASGASPDIPPQKQSRGRDQSPASFDPSPGRPSGAADLVAGRIASARAARAAWRPASEQSLESVPRSAVNMAVAGLLVGLAALLLLANLGDGKLDLSSFSPDRIREFLSARNGLLIRDVSNGLYETGTGRAAFFVRGCVENHGDAAARCKVHVDLVDGPLLLKSADAFAGVPATPEEIYAVGNLADADALNAKSGARASLVAPGAKAEFVVVFYDYPPDLEAFRLKLSVFEAKGPDQTAAR